MRFHGGGQPFPSGRGVDRADRRSGVFPRKGRAGRDASLSSRGHGVSVGVEWTKHDAIYDHAGF